MKKFLLLICFVAQFSATSQTQDLARLASGEYLGFNAVYDNNEELFGYVALYGYGKSSDKTKKFEYVILDKNLNPVANNQFEGDITAADYYAYMDFRNNIVLRPSRIDYLSVKQKDLFTPSLMIINVKDNTISKKTYYDFADGAIKESFENKNWNQERKENKEEKKLKGYNYVSSVYEIKEGGFLVLEFNDYGKYINNNSLIKLNEDRKEVWKYSYNKSGDKKNKVNFRLIDKDENYIYAFLNTEIEEDKKYELLIIDMKTGAEIKKVQIKKFNEKTLDEISYLYSNNREIINQKTFDNKIVMVGVFYSGSNENLGFARLLIDKKTFEIDQQAFLFSDLTSYLPNINRNGDLESGYKLSPRDLFFLSDGSVGVLTEKFKPYDGWTVEKSEDLIYIYTDKDFKVKGTKVFDKEKSKYFTSDYLFSQYINEGKDVVFFYRDYQKNKETKESNWKLFVNTLIDGKFNQEMIPMSLKNNFYISIYRAKEGFVLFQEANYKEKQYKIRLEKMNY
ncbi:MAG: hypothetical protein V4670_11955 [Bacteroidota bacterium]